MGSPVRVYMIEEEALFAKCDEGGSLKKSSIKDTISMVRLTDCV